MEADNWQLTQNFLGCFDEILDIMKEIGDLLQCYKLFSSAYRSSLEMSKVIVGAYTNIISFWHRIAKLYKRGGKKIFTIYAEDFTQQRRTSNFVQGGYEAIEY
jgi:hypothetical protein